MKGRGGCEAQFLPFVVGMVYDGTSAVKLEKMSAWSREGSVAPTALARVLSINSRRGSI
jgi:hypothetical protein